jgi:hypothetical protein
LKVLCLYFLYKVSKSVNSNPKNTQFLAWFTSLGDKFSSSWINTLPKYNNPEYTINNQAFKIIIKRYIQCPMSNIAGLKCKCDNIADNCGNHILTCGYGGVRISLHDTILNLLYKFLQICNDNVSKETAIDTYDYLCQRKLSI